MMDHYKSVSYGKAQEGMRLLKVAIHEVLEQAPEEGLTNAQIGRTLGIYGVHVEHEGHISRSLLEQMKNDQVVEQLSPRGPWRLRNHFSDDA